MHRNVLRKKSVTQVTINFCFSSKVFLHPLGKKYQYIRIAINI